MWWKESFKTSRLPQISILFIHFKILVIKLILKWKCHKDRLFYRADPGTDPHWVTSKDGMKHPCEQCLGGGVHESLSIDSVCFLTELVEEFYLKICAISQMKEIFSSLIPASIIHWPLLPLVYLFLAFHASSFILSHEILLKENNLC